MGAVVAVVMVFALVAMLNVIRRETVQHAQPQLAPVIVIEERSRYRR